MPGVGHHRGGEEPDAAVQVDGVARGCEFGRRAPDRVDDDPTGTLAALMAPDS